MNELLLQTVIEKLDSVEMKIKNQQHHLQNLQHKDILPPDIQDRLNGISTGMETIQQELKNSTSIKNQLQDLSTQLHLQIAFLKQPRKNEIRHHHYFPKVVWVSVGLFAIAVAAIIAWYNTREKMKLYQANDIKYRYLKQTANPDLLNYLYRVDSLERVGFSMEDSVIVWEQEEMKMIELEKARAKSANKNRKKDNLIKLMQESKKRREFD